MNFLILAAGTRNKIVQYFKKTFEGIGAVVACLSMKEALLSCSALLARTSALFSTTD